MDKLTVMGIVLAIALIVTIQGLELNDWSLLFNTHAFLIVLGGTFIAVIVQTPSAILKDAIRTSVWVFKSPKRPNDEYFKKFLEWAGKSRKQGILSLEQELKHESNRFVRSGLESLMAGLDGDEIRSFLQTKQQQYQQRQEAAIEVFQSMGGYCPTFGILGAVLGLINVMQNLHHTEEMTTGIAIAFLATVYGVAAANLIFIPVANKLKYLLGHQVQFYQMTIEALTSIHHGKNPELLNEKLKPFVELN